MAWRTLKTPPTTKILEVGRTIQADLYKAFGGAVFRTDQVCVVRLNVLKGKKIK